MPHSREPRGSAQLRDHPETLLAIPNRAIEHADYAAMIGNDFVYSTYAFAGKPIFELGNPAMIALDLPSSKDFDASRRRFLWLGGRGSAHKGLGRVLEAFEDFCGFHLTVCGPVTNEPDFCRAYHRQLYQTPNIQLRGWIDITRPEFQALAASTLGIVFPSCAEAQAGSVINCMQAGLIPLVSRQVGLDVSPDFGVLLRDSSVQEIRDAVCEIARLPTRDLAAMSRRTWEVAQANHTQPRYSVLFGSIIDRILIESPSKSVARFFRIAHYAPPADRASGQGLAIG